MPKWCLKVTLSYHTCEPFFLDSTCGVGDDKQRCMHVVLLSYTELADLKPFLTTGIFQGNQKSVTQELNLKKYLKFLFLGL